MPQPLSTQTVALGFGGFDLLLAKVAHLNLKGEQFVSVREFLDESN